jgi:hypothetical protein
MKTLLLLPSLFLAGCGMGYFGDAGFAASDNCSLNSAKVSKDPAECTQSGQVPVYSNRFTSSCGASSVKSGADALSGRASGSTSATPSPSVDAPSSAMVVSCADATCPAGQVSVIGFDPMNPSAGDENASCVEAPPSCPDGQSPQYVFSSASWQCTDCALVVTYGGTYGNYSRCTSAPTVQCSDGQVPTWDADSESWQCETTCDNGDYDQHEVDGSTVCVPC